MQEKWQQRLTTFVDRISAGLMMAIEGRPFWIDSYWNCEIGREFMRIQQNASKNIHDPPQDPPIKTPSKDH